LQLAQSLLDHFSILFGSSDVAAFFSETAGVARRAAYALSVGDADSFTAEQGAKDGGADGDRRLHLVL
jgi:hypothetical protein